MTRKQQQRENQAIEAIIAGILRGFNRKDWQKVFRRMDRASLAQSGQVTARQLRKWDEKPWAKNP